jgi:hypothetical protein
MNSVKFPARKPDGSFCIEVGVRVNIDFQVDVRRIQDWISGIWMPNHTTWTRDWRTGTNFATIDEQRLNYNDEFRSPPVIVSGPGSELRLRLAGNRTAKFWKDWLVSRIVPDLRAEFPEIGEVLYIRDCAE